MGLYPRQDLLNYWESLLVKHDSQIRPPLLLGGYVLTKPAPTKHECRVYRDPPDYSSMGMHFAVVPPGCYLGPIESILEVTVPCTCCLSGRLYGWHRFLTIGIPWRIYESGCYVGTVRAYVIVWSSTPCCGAVQYARMIPFEEVRRWEAAGWNHRRALNKELSLIHI